MSVHTIRVTDTYSAQVQVPADADEAERFALDHEAKVQGAADQNEREFHQCAADYYWRLAG